LDHNFDFAVGKTKCYFFYLWDLAIKFTDLQTFDQYNPYLTHHNSLLYKVGLKKLAKEPNFLA